MIKVESMLAQYETKILKAKLREFPALIRDQKTVVATARQNLKEAEQNRAMVEADIMVEIAAETNGDTLKPKYSNAESRAAELARRKLSNKEYQDAEKGRQAAEWLFNEAQFNLEKLVDEFKAYRYIVDLTSNELALLAREETEKEPF